MIALKVIFWTSVIAIIYTYLGYPLLMTVLNKLGSKPVQKRDYYPKVSLIIAAYNEEKHIEAKIKNSLFLDYPKEKLEIIVASDGSTDDTVSILEKYAQKGIKLINSKKRVGKTSVQNEAAKISKGEILFFSDVAAIHPPDVIKKITRNFADETVGCVTGRVKFTIDEENLISKGADLRLKYEISLREKQSRYHSLLGATGCIYAIRKTLFEPLRDDLVSDFVEPLIILEKGYRTVYEPGAFALINRKIDLRREFLRRVRVTQQGLFGLFFMRHLLNPMRFGFLSFSLISHRLLRWWMPLFLVSLFLSNLFLINDKLYLVLLTGQLIFYISGIIGLLTVKENRTFKFLHPLVYFCMVNLAATVGLYRYSRGWKQIYWETLR